MKLPKMLLLSLTTLSLTGLGSCGPNQRIEIVKPPVSLTACADEPEAPDLSAVDAYVLALRSAWGDCSATVAGVKAWAKGLED
jgi:hypothetical protein